MTDSMLYALVVVITLYVVLSIRCFAEDRKEIFEIRATRAARLFLFLFKGGGS